ncbi:MAG: Rrf2 family transcriptional regulator [candidate division Zixibacteria bacterium]|nr:Rrf2 family transcriptional regulator [candidate division Zixibacteria bacterium]
MFSAKAHYGLKAAVYLARQTGKGPIQAKEIAETQNIPVRYLELLLSQMKKARLINSNRGKLGGYRLARPAAAISVFDVIMALEGKVTFVSSHETKDDDLIELAVADFWKQAETNLVAYLKQTSIEDLRRQAETDKQMYHI